METRCVACGHAHRDVRKFCTNCGAPLILTCPGCGSRTTPGERFCGECGQPVGQAAPPTTPGHLTRKILDSRTALEGERKQVTVLFADVKGSMTLQAGLDPEEWAGVMDQLFLVLADSVHLAEGTVDKFTGDGIMAIFGAPVAHEDHARRACFAALHLTQTVGTYAAEVRAEKGLDLHVRVGLNSGEVVVQRIGDDASMEYTALGPTVGLAQRMEAAAEPGRAYLTQHTADLVVGHFLLSDLGPFEVKGFEEPIRVYALDGAAPSRSNRRRATQLMGRQDELGVLLGALEEAERGQSGVLGIVGEAGVGKSRLCEEFVGAAAARGVPVSRSSGISHARTIPFLPMVGLLRDVFATPAVDPPAVTREKLRKRLAGEPSLEEALPLLFDVLEVPDPEQPMPQLSPEVRRRRIVEVLRQVTLQRGEAMVLLLEDLHWFDDQSRLFVEQLLPCTPGTRTLVVTNFRPEFQPSWMGEPYYRHVPLQALDRATTKELLLGYVGGDPSLTSLFDQVVTRTGGNPFFVEEVVRALVEDGTLEGGPGAYRLARPLGETRVPATVQATLAARIDRLPDAGKHALQAASVIGRTFSGLVLAHVLGQRIEELAEELVRLCAAQLLQGEGDDSTDDYRFWHPLTQEVAYGSLLRDRRARLHGAVARALVVLEPERLDARSALIASHFDRAGDPLEAARWERRAANWAQRSDFQDAKRRWHAVLGHLSAVPETEETLELGFEARVRIVQAGARIGLDTEEADLLLGEAEALAEQLHDVRLQGMVTVFRGSASLARMDFRRATQCFLEAGRLGDQLRDPGLMNGVNLCNLTGPLAEAAALTDRSIVHCGGDLDAAQESVGYSPFVRGLFNQADLWSRMARLPEARRQLDRAVALAREHSDTEVLAWGLSLYARLADWTGERDELLFDRARESSQLFEDSGSRVMQLFGLASVALALCLIGDWNEAESVVAQGLAQAGEVRNRWIDPDLLNCLALARLGRHDWTAARDAADEAVELAAGLGTRLFECAARTTRARGCRLTGALAEAEADLVTALDLVRSTDATTYEPFIHEELARLRNDEAELRQAFVLYQAMGAVGHARRVRADLS